VSACPHFNKRESREKNTPVHKNMDGGHFVNLSIKKILFNYQCFLRKYRRMGAFVSECKHSAS